MLSMSVSIKRIRCGTWIGGFLPPALSQSQRVVESSFSRVVRTSSFSSSATAYNEKALHKWLDRMGAQGNKVLSSLDDAIVPHPLLQLACSLNIPPSEDSWLTNSERGIHPAGHFLFFAPYTPTNQLAADGFETELQPPEPFGARMWAGGEINFVVRSPRLGERVRQTVSLPTSPVLKHGKNGPLVFVSRKHDIYSLDEQKLLMSDTTNFAYKLREKRSVPQSDSTAATSSAPPSLSASVVYRREHIDLNEILLFRFSAMTWNSHKIHYEKAFAQSDGYADILVHGPLTATLLLDHLGKVSEVLAGREPAAFKQQQAEKAAAVAAASHSAQKHAHSHSHSHGGVPCTGHHATPPDETPYHMKFHSLKSFHYKALRPLLVNTKVHIKANTVEENAEKQSTIVRVWCEDAGTGAVYMEGTAAFVRN